MPTRSQHAHTERWSEIQQLRMWPKQRLYELVRPIVLFSGQIAERAQETSAPERSLRRQADRFDAEGMASLFRPTRQQQQDTYRSLPSPIRQAIVDLKAECVALSLHEIGRICFVRFNRAPSPHTIQRVLAEGPAPGASGGASGTARRYPRYAEIPDPAARRHAVVALHAEGWTATRIARYLAISRTTVHAILNRWVTEEVMGIEDKSHANTRPVRKVDLTTKRRIRQLQENPELGAFRIQAALRREGIFLSQATCGRILAEHPQLYGFGKPQPEPKPPKEHPYKAQYRHQIWSVDVRYIEHHQIPGITGPF